ncbi:MAG: IS66 family transposase [Planctomycetaceae bacterium]
MSVTPRLPDDPGECQRLLDDLLRRNDELRRQAEDARRQAEEARRRIDELQRVLEETAADYSQLQEKHAELAETLALFRRYVFGPRRERLVDDPDQGHLFDLHDIVIAPEPVVPTEPDAAPPVPRTKASRPHRRIALDHLPHIRIEHDLTEAEKTCSCCGGPKQRIGEDLSRELEFIPAKLEVKVHVLPKYACPKCRDGVASPPVPPKPVPGGIAGPGLVAFVVVSKFSDHLPLYRLEDILTRHGVFLSRSTLCDWVRNAALILGPLAELQRTLVLQSPVIWTDDTPVCVLGGEKPGSTKGRFWVYIGDDAHPYSVYDFTMSRSRDGPAAFLADYRGFLQADAYGGYDGIFLGSNGMIEEVACWAHARRKFYDARSNAPREANQILEWIRQLYDVEDRARDFTPEQRQALRQRESVPILDRLEKYLDELSERVLPKSALGKAMTYARNQRAALRRHVSDGRLTIHNNLSERTLRLQAIGRKNWEFLGSSEAGPRAAVLFSILAGAKRHRLEPWAYLRDVLLRLSAGETDLEPLLPDLWAASHPEHVLQYRLDESRRKAARQKEARQARRAEAEPKG